MFRTFLASTWTSFTAYFLFLSCKVWQSTKNAHYRWQIVQFYAIWICDHIIRISLISWKTNFTKGSKPRLWVDDKESAILPLFIFQVETLILSSWATDNPQDHNTAVSVKYGIGLAFLVQYAVLSGEMLAARDAGRLLVLGPGLWSRVLLLADRSEAGLQLPFQAPHPPPQRCCQAQNLPQMRSRHAAFLKRVWRQREKERRGTTLCIHFITYTRLVLDFSLLE